MGSLLTGLMLQKEMEAKEKLSALEKMAKAQLEANKTRIMNGSTIDQELHTGTVVSRMQRIYAASSSDASTIKDCISDFFNGEVTDGILKLVNVALDAILGNTSIGEVEIDQMLILWENDALIRFDLYYWKWNFSGSGVIDVAENVMAVYCLKRVMDIETVPFSVLVFAIEGMLKNKDQDVDDQNAIDEVQSILTRVFETKKAINALREESSVDPSPAKVTSKVIPAAA